jgi:hypothetical protein
MQEDSIEAIDHVSVPDRFQLRPVAIGIADLLERIVVPKDIVPELRRVVLAFPNLALDLVARTRVPKDTVCQNIAIRSLINHQTAKIFRSFI